MIKILLFDFSRVLLFPKDKNYTYGLNRLHKELFAQANYKIFDHFELNEELINYIDKLRNKVESCIFTTGIIQDSPEIAILLKPIFKKIYSSGKLGLSKQDSRSYLYIVQDLNIQPSEILFIDDTSINLETANQAGLQILQYVSNQQMMSFLNSLF